MNWLFRTPRLTRTRIALAMAVALCADGLQLLLALLGPVGMVLDEIVDVIGMLLITWLIGFHPLLLPTFIVELVPVVEMLPTWTACVGLVIVLKKRSQNAEPIDVTVTSERVSEPKT